MALSPKIKICLASDCTTLTFSDITGIYNSQTTVGGYGTPNPEINDFVSANLKVISPSNNEYTIDLFGTGDFPTTNKDLKYTINLEDLERTSIEDGYWEFMYTLLDDNNNTFTYNISYYFYCNSKCCADKMLSKIDLTDNLFKKENKEKMDTYTQVKVLLASLINSAECFNENNFNNIKKEINKLCKNINCNTCN
jgi:hypothetical protein